MQGLDLIIFDCDGVLVDSEIVAARVEARLLSAAGFEITPEEIAERYAGLNFQDILLRIESETGTPFQASLIDKAEKMVDERLDREVKAVDGALAAIDAVGTRTCICSNSSSDRLARMLARTGIASRFSGTVFSARDTGTKRPKPAPDVFLHAAEAMHASPARTIVVEDSVHGIAGARAAGMRVVGFTGASHSYPGHADVLTEAGAETVIHRLADLRLVLEALAAWSEDEAIAL